MTRARHLLWLLILGVALAMVLVEAVLRLVPVPAIEIHRRASARAENPVFFEYDPELGWRGRPGARGTLTGWEFTSDVRLNSRGFRDAEVDVAKSPGVFRIVLLGDSITWGHGVEQAQRYGDLLAAAVRQGGARAEVVNLAVSGYATDQELLLWERAGGQYCADVVLLGLYENDVRENADAFQGRYPKPYFRASPDGTLALANVPVPRVPDWGATPPKGRSARDWFRRHLRLWAALAFLRQAIRGETVATPPAVAPGSVDLTAALVRRLAASVSRDGSAFGVVVLPDLYYSATTMEAALRAGVVPTLDLTPLFRRAAAGGPPLFQRLDGAHWTPRAHAIAAQTLAQWIRDDSTLRRSPRGCGHVA